MRALEFSANGWPDRFCFNAEAQRTQRNAEEAIAKACFPFLLCESLRLCVKNRPSNCKLTTKTVLTILAVLLALAQPSRAQVTWQEAFAKMPLPETVSTLDRSNCVRLMLVAFRPNPAVKALIFMPGATDEFYFFNRAHATLTNPAPSLLDAVCALTNQTYIRVAVRPPFLLLHGVEDPLEPAETVEDQKTADRLRKEMFEATATL